MPTRAHTQRNSGKKKEKPILIITNITIKVIVPLTKPTPHQIKVTNIRKP